MKMIDDALNAYGYQRCGRRTPEAMWIVLRATHDHMKRFGLNSGTSIKKENV